jgi:tetratricopeptide (TPR) repeat protein
LADRLGADFYSIDALHMMGIVEPPERQLEWSMRALSLAEGSGDERARKWRGALYNNIGWTFHDLGDYEKALEMFKRSLAFRIEMDDTAGMMIAGWTIARTERSLGQVEEALDLQLGLARDLEKYGLPEDGYVYEEIAECLLLLDRKEESKEYFGRAYAILSKDDWMVANEPDRLARLNDLSR